MRLYSPEALDDVIISEANHRSERPCPLCGSRMFANISQKMQHNGRLRTVICMECSLVFTNPAPDEITYKKYYMEEYATHYGHLTPAATNLNTQIINPAISQKLRWISQFLPLSGKKLLEIGPGQGLFLWWARYAGANVTGIEPSEPFQAALENENIPYFPENFEQIQLQGTYDIIVMFHVLEHIFDPNLALQKAHALLPPDGLLIIEVPNILKPFRSLDSYFLRYVHLVNYSPETLKSMLAKHGFICVFMETGGNSWKTPQNLFVIAKKSDSCTSILPEQRWESIVSGLNAYRCQWKWWGRFRYWQYLWIGNLKRRAVRLLRPLARRLVRK